MEAKDNLSFLFTAVDCVSKFIMTFAAVKAMRAALSSWEGAHRAFAWNKRQRTIMDSLIMGSMGMGLVILLVSVSTCLGY